MALEPQRENLVCRFEACWVLFRLYWGQLADPCLIIHIDDVGWIRDMFKRYSQEFKDRAVRMLVDRLAGDGSCSQWQAVREIAPKLGVANESLRRWYEQHLVNTGERQGLTREEHEEVKRLKREVAEPVRRANEILKTASAFFAAELDRPAR
jgi:transposase